MDRINQEYTRYLLISDIAKILYKLSNTKYVYEIDASMERFLIACANVQAKNRIDAIFYKLSANDPNIVKLEEEIYNKTKTPSVLIKKKLQYIIELINRFINDMHKYKKNGYEPIIEEKLIVNKNIYKYGTFEYKFNEQRLEVLKKRATESGNHTDFAFTFNVDILLMTMLLRYECLHPQGNQWGFSLEMYKNLYDNFNVRLECFASPKNSQLILLGDDTNFCSLFYDTDKYFGSLGNFFDLHNNAIFLDKYKNSTLMCNPPYIEKLMNDCSDYMSVNANIFTNTIIFNVPNWTDAKFYIDSVNKKPLYDEFMESYKHYYINNHSDIKQIKATFKSHIFVFGNEKIDVEFYRNNLTIGYRL
jgi:hypothetical protein